jgi:hypothetical protein
MSRGYSEFLRSILISGSSNCLTMAIRKFPVAWCTAPRYWRCFHEIHARRLRGTSTKPDKVMKKSAETVYRCNYCNRPMFGASAMSSHEKVCPKSPNNKHKCFEFCIHLEKIFTECGTEFICRATGDKMYSYKIEGLRKWRNRGIIASLQRMPLKCDHYKDRVCECCKYYYETADIRCESCEGHNRWEMAQ